MDCFILNYKTLYIQLYHFVFLYHISFILISVFRLYQVYVLQLSARRVERAKERAPRLFRVSSANRDTNFDSNSDCTGLSVVGRAPEQQV